MTKVPWIALLWFAGCAAAAMGAGQGPFADAVAVWHMADPKDSAGKSSDLTSHGDVSTGIELSGAERISSLARGGDGHAAQFGRGGGGYLDAGQGANGELNVAGRA